MPTPTIARTLPQLGFMLIGGALLSAEAAWLHMRELLQTSGVICGSASAGMAPCPACYAGVSFFAAGAAAIILAHADRPATLLRAGPNPSA